MQLTPHTQLALRTLIYLASRGRAGAEPTLVKTDSIVRYLESGSEEALGIIEELSRLGLLCAEGPEEDYVRLKRPVEEINLGEVIRSFEGSLCLLGPQEPDEDPAGAALRRLEEVLGWGSRELESFLGQYTLDQLLPRARTAEEPVDSHADGPNQGGEPSQKKKGHLHVVGR